tara:strand:- start:3145 stop:3345 length:201 start_codon:yes stop_codon:yes gene_type:complete
MKYSNFRPGWAAEVILDNWSIVGCFITEELLNKSRENGTISSLIDDVGATGLPCHIFSKSGYVGKL